MQADKRRISIISHSACKSLSETKEKLIFLSEKGIAIIWIGSKIAIIIAEILWPSHDRRCNLVLFITILIINICPIVKKRIKIKQID